MSGRDPTIRTGEIVGNGSSRAFSAVSRVGGHRQINGAHVKFLELSARTCPDSASSLLVFRVTKFKSSGEHRTVLKQVKPDDKRVEKRKGKKRRTSIVDSGVERGRRRVVLKANNRGWRTLIKGKAFQRTRKNAKSDYEDVALSLSSVEAGDSDI